MVLGLRMFRRFLENKLQGQGPNDKIGDSDDGPVSKANSSLSEENNSKQNEKLSSFDACIEACDELASTSTSSGRVDPKTGLVDCSVLVSADGELLIIPQAQQLQKEELKKDNRTKSLLDRTSSDFGEEYQSAIFMGNDLDVVGDQGLNGFSAKGWSIPAQTLAVKQSADAMGDLTDFVESLLLAKKSTSAQESRLINQLKPLVEGNTRVEEYHKLLTETFPDQSLDLLTTRAGPLAFQEGTVHSTMSALQNYYCTIAASEAERWRTVADPSGPLTKLKAAKAETDKRESNRRVALQEMLEKKHSMEHLLANCKEDAARKWNDVHDTEERVTKLLEDKMLERSRLKEQKRLEKIKQAEKKRVQDSSQGNPGATSSEILDIVSAVTANFDEGSFEPMDLPQMNFSSSTEQSDNQDPDGVNTSTSTEEDIQISLPMASRHDLEFECGLPELRVAALAADDAVEDAANSLLSLLASWDLTRRSSRLAAETCLIGSCNAQTQCLRSIIDLERQAIDERSKLIDELEAIAFNIDVRGDIDDYIKFDKKEPGGRSFLGDDDDGGLAAALTVLENHSDGDFGIDRRSLGDSITSLHMDDDYQISPEYLDEAIDSFFNENPLLGPNAETEEGHQTAMDEFEDTVSRLCNVGNDRSSAGRLLRSTICFSLNAKRNHHDEIPTMIQFVGLCRLFSALLAACENHGTGASLAKMLMTLSQIFYFCESVSADEGERKETFVKTHLVNHPLWNNDELWNNVLNQDIAENLTHSGLMANFERPSSRILTATTKKRSEWTEANKMKWYDLRDPDRYEAASQVHAIVFAQLGTLAHTMIAFGCGLHRSCAFVRRMAVRYRLPISQRTMLLQHLMLSATQDAEAQPPPPL